MDAGQLSLEASSQAMERAIGPAAALLAQTLVERQGCQGGRRHTLPIDGIESAGGVSRDDQVLWPAGESLVVTPAIFRRTIPSDGGERFRVLDRFVEDRAGKASRELQEAGFVRRGIVPAP